MLISMFERDPGSTLDIRRIGQILGGALSIWLTMAPLCMILFFIAPRARTTMVQFQPASQRTYSGFSDQITLGSVKNIQSSEELAFRAETEPLLQQQLYWRGLTFEFFNGETWLPLRRGISRAEFTSEGERIVQKILLEPSYNRMVFALDKPLSIRGNNIMPLGDGLFVRTDSRAAGRIEYTAVSTVSQYMKPLNPNVNKSLYLSLPEGYIPRLRQIVGDLTRGLTDREKTNAIMNYLAPPDFEYTLTDLPVSSNPLEEFVFSSKRGNCEFFASAMAVMLRMAGVPSRIVAGYQGGVYNRSGGYYIVGQSNAHVWVEVWDAVSSSWVRRDPTPAVVSINSSQSDEKYNLFSFYVDMLNYNVSRIFLEYDSESQSELYNFLRAILSNPSDALSRNADVFITAARGGTVLLSIAALIFALWRVAKIIRVRRTDREEVLLSDFLRAMKRRGYEKKICDGLEEFAASVEKNREKENSAELASLARSFALRFDEFYFRDLPIDASSESELRAILKRIKSRRRTI
jgi:transglutaminase-like putative cysteine protease